MQRVGFPKSLREIHLLFGSTSHGVPTVGRLPFLAPLLRIVAMMAGVALQVQQKADLFELDDVGCYHHRQHDAPQCLGTLADLALVRKDAT